MGKSFSIYSDLSPYTWHRRYLHSVSVFQLIPQSNECCMNFNLLNIFSVYQKSATVQLENELQNSKVQFRPVQLNVSAIDISNATTVENTSLLDSFPSDLFTGILWNFRVTISQNIQNFSSIIWFTDSERLDGAIIFHISAAIYFFVLLAVVCQDYFLPAVECICDDLNISKVIICQPNLQNPFF